MTDACVTQDKLQIQQLEDNIYSFVIPLPENPLKWLNTYVIRTRERNLLVDTGFRRPECFQALIDGMAALGIHAEDTDVFLTHLHSDHTGNTASLQRLGCRIIMGETDRKLLIESHRAQRELRMLREGMPDDVLVQVRANNPATLYAPEEFTCTEVENGSRLTYGAYTLTCIQAPGHTPGHMCLYDSEKQIMFLGDHILFDISPNITYWVNRPDSLGDYLESLKKFADIDIKLALPAHRTQGCVSTRERAFQLMKHHEDRLEETLNACAGRGVPAYEIAGRISWAIRARSWDEFPPGQKWFAMGETLAHLDRLVLLGKLRRITDEDGIVKYY